MDDGIIASIIIGICFWGFVGIIKTITDYRIRKKLAESCKADLKTENIELTVDSSRFINLKWGIVILLGGAGLILLHFLDLSSETPLPYGIESIFIASGFLFYFFIEKYANTKS